MECFEQLFQNCKNLAKFGDNIFVNQIPLHIPLTYLLRAKVALNSLTAIFNNFKEQNISKLGLKFKDFCYDSKFPF